MIYGTVELISGEIVDANYEYHPVAVGQLFQLDAAGDFRKFEVIELLNAKPQIYKRCDNGRMQDMPIYAYRMREIPAMARRLR